MKRHYRQQIRKLISVQLPEAKLLRKLFFSVGVLSLAIFLPGCVVRTYTITKERVDHDMGTGNRGYIQGKPSSEEQIERKPSRTIRQFEIEMHPLIKFENIKKGVVEKTTPDKTGTEESSGNRGYIVSNEVSQPAVQPKAAEVFQNYTVQKADTLQKISLKFYGTTKKWNIIYEANKDKLKAPDRIYPGQVVNVPVERLRETGKNLK